MKDIHSQIKPIVKMFTYGCAINKIVCHYLGHSHHSRGIDLTFKICRFTTAFFIQLQAHFQNFTIHNDNGYVTISIRLFDDDGLPY